MLKTIVAIAQLLGIVLFVSILNSILNDPGMVLRGLKKIKPPRTEPPISLPKLMKSAISTFALGFLLAAYVLQLIQFALAYTNESMQVVISVNNFGEAGLELFLYAVSIPCVALYLMWKTQRRRKIVHIGSDTTEK